MIAFCPEMAGTTIETSIKLPIAFNDQSHQMSVYRSDDGKQIHIANHLYEYNRTERKYAAIGFY